MRHDSHYVEALASSAGSPIGRLVPIDRVDPNPEQPRQVMGDLSELMASIAEKGVIEPLVVRQRGHRYQIIAGERRYQAAVQLGMRELPVVIREVDDTEIIEIALVENIQRKDLGPFEEAEAMASLAERCGYTHEDLAKRLGKSRTSITESLALAEMPSDIRNLCRLADMTAAPASRASRLAKPSLSPSRRSAAPGTTCSSTARPPRPSASGSSSGKVTSIGPKSSPPSKASSLNSAKGTEVEPRRRLKG
jgi:ParB family chromosome partitioning protein